MGATQRPTAPSSQRVFMFTPNQAIAVSPPQDLTLQLLIDIGW